MVLGPFSSTYANMHISSLMILQTDISMKPYNNIYVNLLENHHFNILMILAMVKITKYQG